VEAGIKRFRTAGVIFPFTFAFQISISPKNWYFIFSSFAVF
jgi:hypothetical protein